MKPYFACLLTAFLLVGPGRPAALPAATPVVISEMMADNTRTMADEDGAFSDWIELQNVSSAPVNLAGWHLTDEVDFPSKWTFPSVNLSPGAYLVVFASGKNRTNPAGRLHTNFQLDSAGEYLALVQPDGQIALAFAPAFPPQVADVSYGTDRQTARFNFVTNGATARWMIPLTAADAPAEWPNTNFNHSSWASGRTGLGFDLGPSNLVTGGTATNVALGQTAVQSSTLGGFTADLAVNGTTADFTHTAAGQNLPATWTVNLGTNYGLEQIILRNREGCCGSRLRDITVAVLDSAGATKYSSALLNPENSLGSGLNGPASLTLNLTQLTGGLVLGSQVRITRTPDPDLSGTGGQGNGDEADVLSLAEVEVLGVGTGGNLATLVRTDLAAAMRNVNATALIRIPFQVVAEELPALDQLLLRMNYDDGFVAYLNGTRVAAVNAPANPAWNSAATADHPNAAAATPETFDLSAYADLLQDGENILAIHGLNQAAGDPDFLIRPELAGAATGQPIDRYFTQPTPGAANGGGALGFVADTKFSVDRGFYETPISLVITSATAGAAIYYTTNGSTPSEFNGTLFTSPIPINRTTVVRAIATKAGYTPSDVDTHTYVFLSQVVNQSFQSVTNAGYPATWAGVAADYAMDTRITGPSAGQMIPSLRSLPSLFLSTSISNLFSNAAGNAGGIYANPTRNGIAFERPAAIEMVDTNGATEFHENIGLRIQGGYFRDPNVTQKHSLRVLFKGQYGAGKLQHDLFRESDAVHEFDGFVLRAGANDGYAWNEAKDTEQFTRVQFGGDLHRAMGHPTPHGQFVHLYFNGVYWGLYNLVERPNEDFSASYFGGDPLDWDANNAGDVKNGDNNAWNTLTSLAQAATTAGGYQRLLGHNADGSPNPAYPVYFDRVDYIDYMIVNIWGGNWDWPNKNYWYGRDRTTNSTGFKFYMWDFENTMGNNRARSPINMISPRSGTENTGVGTPHFYLKSNLEYRMDFADRVQQFFFNDGLLTVGALTNRYRALADQVEMSIYAETARWGDDNLNPPQDIDDWRRERDWILGSYLVQRSDVVLQQFRAAGLYPAVGAPFFSSSGGFVAPDAQLTITQTNAGGILYYTTDGSDPRQIGGSVASVARLYTAPVPIGGNAVILARVRVGTNWSALVRASFTTAAYFKDLAITEIMYNPPGTATVSGDEFEFIELKNTGATALNLSGVSFVSGITFAFTNDTRLAPGAFLVLARNSAQFQSRYPGVPVHGVYSGRLDNAGETLRLAHAIGGSLFAVTYGDEAPWPLAPDGHGFSLVPSAPTANLNSDQPAHWRASSAQGGSPGADDPTPGIPAVVINEVLTHTVVGLDFVELHNATAAPVSIAGWFLTDDKTTPQKFRIPGGPSIPAGGYVVFTEADFNPTPGLGTSFTFNGAGDAAYLFSADAGGQLTGYSHGFTFDAAPEAVSFGRHVLSTGEEQFPLQHSVSPGQANAGPQIGPVVISEVHYHPRPGDDAFIEIKNPGSTPVPLYQGSTTNTWRLNGIDFRFPAGVSLAPGGFAVVASSAPDAFRARFNVPAAVPVFGPYGGALQDSGERLQLQWPDPRGTNGIVFVTMDEVRYNDRAPWPTAADGIGPSLQRQPLLSFGNEPLNWRAASPNPGRDFAGGIAPTIERNPANVTIVATREATFEIAASGPGALSYQWRFNGAAIPGANSATLTLTDLQPNQAGLYTAVVYNDAGAVESAPATLTVLIPARILQQPADALVRIKPDPQAAPVTNATFVIAAASTSPISYQWLYNGSAVPGATDPVLTITNVQRANEGLYSVAITDAAGTIFSQAANLYPLITPTFVEHPTPQEVAPGAPVTLSVAITGSPRPFTYEWRRGSTPIVTNVSASAQDFITFAATNAVPSTNRYRVIVRNLANETPGVAGPLVNVVVLPDSDADGMLDAWEIRYGLNPANAGDASADPDGDGLSNRQEHDTGTNPNDANSFLRVDLNRQTSQAQIMFGATSNRTYTLQYADPKNLSWQRLVDFVGRPADHVETIVDPIIQTNRIYRVVTPRQP